MKKIYTFIAAFLVMGSFASRAQDTLIYESFNFQAFYDQLISDVVPPPGNTNDTLWYSFDGDGLADGSGSTTARPGGWFAIQPFSPVDTTNNVSIAANSWFASPGLANNWLITPSILLGTADTLFWKSAPRQTPRYLDGYEVRLSTTTNDDLAFTGAGSALLFSAAEMTALGSDTTFSTFTFSSGFVHGQDGTYIDTPSSGGATASFSGQLRPFSVPLNTWANQNIFIGFHQNCFDDNLISIDDVMIRGVLPAIGIRENSNDMNLSVFPNPATDIAQVNYNLTAECNVTITIYDITGKVISTDARGNQAAGRHFTAINTADMAKGFYTVSVQTNLGRSNTKLIVK